MKCTKAIITTLGLWLSFCPVTGRADIFEEVRLRFQADGFWTLERCRQDGSESFAEGFAVSFSETDAIVFGPRREVLNPVEWTPYGVMFGCGDDQTEPSAHTFTYTGQPTGFDLIDGAGNVALQVRIVARAHTCERSNRSVFFATVTTHKSSPLAMLEGTNWLLSYNPRTAQPGATDNPDDAQRLREDH